MTDSNFDLERAAARLGQRAAESLDVERVASGVVNRLHNRRPWWQASGLLRAAAVVVLLGGGVMLGRGTITPEMHTAVQPHPAAPVFEGLTASDLADVLDSMVLEAPPSSYPRGLHDLNESQLRELLSLES